MKQSSSLPTSRIIYNGFIGLIIWLFVVILAGILAYCTINLDIWRQYFKDISESNLRFLNNQSSDWMWIVLFLIIAPTIIRTITKLPQIASLGFEKLRNRFSRSKKDHLAAVPKLFSDEPNLVSGTTDSRLVLAKLLADIIQKNQETHVYGLNAPWGRGKTTIMKEAEKRLREEAKPTPVTLWLDAWSMGPKDDPIISLVEAIRAALDGQTFRLS